MRRKQDNNATGRLVITILSVLCLALIVFSVLEEHMVTPVRNVTGVVVTPIQKGVNRFGTWLSSATGNFSDAATLREENESLRAQVDALTVENSQLLLNKEELDRLRGLLDLADEYSNYETVGARVISKETGNWFSTFTIDKGTADGIQVNCNVLGGAGLVGIVTQAGPDWATVRSIIDDNSNVSAQISTTSDTCIIAGNLELIDKGTLNLVKLQDEDNKAHVGDKVVTSNISEKFLPGILIGYISALDNDSNNLTKSGEITPVVDFRHLQEVLVIKELKQYVASPQSQRGRGFVNDVSDEEREEETEG